MGRVYRRGHIPPTRCVGAVRLVGRRGRAGGDDYDSSDEELERRLSAMRNFVYCGGPQPIPQRMLATDDTHRKGEIFIVPFETGSPVYTPAGLKEMLIQEAQRDVLSQMRKGTRLNEIHSHVWIQTLRRIEDNNRRVVQLKDIYRDTPQGVPSNLLDASRWRPDLERYSTVIQKLVSETYGV